MYINNKNINDKIKEINVFRSLGYSKRHLSSILYIENLVLGLKAIFLSNIIILVTYGIYMVIKYFKPFILQKLPITIDFMALIITDLILLLLIMFTTFVFKKKIFNKNIIVGIKE